MSFIHNRYSIQATTNVTSTMAEVRRCLLRTTLTMSTTWAPFAALQSSQTGCLAACLQSSRLVRGLTTVTRPVSVLHQLLVAGLATADVLNAAWISLLRAKNGRSLGWTLERPSSAMALTIRAIVLD